MANDYDDLQRPRKNALSLRTVLIICIIVLALLICAGVAFFALSKPKEQVVVPEPVVSEQIIEEPVSQPQEPAKVEDADKAVAIDKIRAKSFDSQVQYMSYTVKPGDTISSISKAFELSDKTIISVNRITNPLALKSGDVLQIPDRDGFIYVVQSGDTLSFIKNQFDLSMGYLTLQEINGLLSDSLKEGQTLFIPDEASSSSISMTAGGLRFVDPLQGRTIVYFGQNIPDPYTKRITSLEGIYIQAPEGSEVRASARGTVLKAGFNNDLGAYEVVVSHDGHYVTSYINLASIAIEAGSSVESNQVIGELGKAIVYSTASDVLYFKIEQDSIALDPSSIL